MRLVCPNCAAQYDVDDRVIPPGGRDVQCSNCGHSWFQPPAAAEPAAPAPPETEEPAAPVTGAAPEAAPETPAPETPATQDAGGDVADGADTAPETGRRLPHPEEDAAWEDDEPVDHLPGADSLGAEPAAARHGDAPETGTDQNRRAMDEAVLSILREEAEREARARKAEAERGMEEQGELGLPPPAPVPRRPEPATEPAVGQAETAPEPAAETPLPDADAITATLAAQEPPATGPEEPVPAAASGRSGFRTGFSLMLALGLLALTAYVLAPALSTIFPGMAGPLADYVAWVNELRLALDATLRGLVAGDTGGA